MSYYHLVRKIGLITGFAAGYVFGCFAGVKKGFAQKIQIPNRNQKVIE